uniref:Serine/threonine-protein kinase STE20-like protein n=1 Tax=Halisarca dujardinii TaxID=2583056 RepID=A0AA96MPL8_HALDU|nr:serine/threonine-protein kinase STE20-like protein [Halisarca dujardinii]
MLIPENNDVYFALFIASTSLLALVMVGCSVAWCVCYCRAHKQRRAKRRIKSFRRRVSTENGNVQVGQMQLDLMAVEAEVESAAAQPYEVPLPRAAPPHSNANRSVPPVPNSYADPNSSTSYYEEPAAVERHPNRSPSARKKLDTPKLAHNGTPAPVETDSRRENVATNIMDEANFYDDPNYHEPASVRSKKKHKPPQEKKEKPKLLSVDIVTPPSAAEEQLPRFPLVAEPECSSRVPNELEMYMNVPLRDESILTSSSDGENEDSPTIIREGPLDCSKRDSTLGVLTSTAYQELDVIQVEELEENEDNLYQNVHHRPNMLQIQRSKQEVRSSYINLEDLQEHLTPQQEPQPRRELNPRITSIYITADSLEGLLKDNENEKDAITENLWEPQGNASQIHMEMSLRHYPLLDNFDIEYVQKLGEGEFGEVYKGKRTIQEEIQLVAVKELKTSASEEDRTKLLKEAALMGQFKHKHIVALLGVISQDTEVSLIMEFLEEGDLKKYLAARKMQAATMPHLNKRLLKFCIHIADAMSYLSGRGFIHRDLAARNILLDRNMNCKIADFGMSRDLEGSYYYKSRGGRIPLKWTAPEAILFRKYSTKSDVWSYGMVMYEIWSFGHEPFEDFKVEEVISKFDCGYCQHPPPGCPRPVYHMMVKCWNPDAHQRPKFPEIYATLTSKSQAMLTWSSRDSAEQESTILGSHLHYGSLLYQDLQEKYNL